jgi:hypothetical protein
MKSPSLTLLGASDCTGPNMDIKRPRALSAKSFANLMVCVREAMIERLEISMFSGALDLTTDQWAAVLHSLFPEEFREPPAPKTPTPTPPFTADRVEAYARRDALGESLYHPGDAAGDSERRGLKAAWYNGRGPHATGWGTEQDLDDDM